MPRAEPSSRPVVGVDLPESRSAGPAWLVTFKDQWSLAIDLAAEGNDVEVKAQLELGYKHHLEQTQSFSTNKNSVYLEARAEGGLFESSTIHVVAMAKLVRVQ